jgi:hypothetical protein
MPIRPSAAWNHAAGTAFFLFAFSSVLAPEFFPALTPYLGSSEISMVLSLHRKYCQWNIQKPIDSYFCSRLLLG